MKMYWNFHLNWIFLCFNYLKKKLNLPRIFLRVFVTPKLGRFESAIVVLGGGRDPTAGYVFRRVKSKLKWCITNISGWSTQSSLCRLDRIQMQNCI